MNKRIDIYIFLQILKSCSLIFFIFITIAWLMQLTRLFTLSNLIQIDILNITPGAVITENTKYLVNTPFSIESKKFINWAVHKQLLLSHMALKQ